MSTALIEKEKPPVSSEASRNWMEAAERIAAVIAAEAAEHDADDSFVARGYQLLKDEGLMKACVPVEFGGYGATIPEMCAVIRKLGASCGSTALAFAMHTHMVATAAWRFKHQKAPTDGLLKRLAAENLILVSSGGSDWLKSAGMAVKVEGGFNITATKVFASGSPVGDILMTSAVHDDPQTGPTVLHFGVPLKAKGVTVKSNWRAMGMRGTGSNDIELKDVFVADAAIAGKRPQGKWHLLFHIISMIAFPIIYSAYLGVAEGARARAIALAKKRAGDEGTAFLVGEMENAFYSAETIHADMIHVAETAQPGPETTNRVMMARTQMAGHAIRTIECAMEAAGGAAFYRDTGIERAFRDVQGARFHPLQAKPQLRYTGRLAMGLDIDG
ncbi:MAG TPA: acyl-CoA dehydrogenase family protein [Hyphomonadaceae bacterium]|nr:acyl-CoA dehydrogenase family protein [Hyphomonadaceae bacterium]